ncbi:YDG domain-containing protein, partial [Belliella aquatica]|uniref:YDG domain-containing protein n=1 Tax=Belliella aquatica TaxID=1323734 RepID=UPI001E5C6F48
DVTAGALSGVATGEDVTVTAVATYDDETVGTGKTITVVYTLSGADAGNYTALANFVVTDGEITGKSISDAVIADIAVQIYTGASIEPDVVLEDGGVTLVEGVDYEVTFTDNKDAGTATVTIKGIGIYSGEFNGSFVISPKTLNIIPDNGQSKSYGALDPEFTYTFSGAIIGEIPSFEGLLGRDSGEGVGNYEIDLGSLALKDNGSFKAANYQVDLTTGVDFTITRAALTITANDDSKFVTQADANGYAGVSYSGFKFGEDESALNTTNLTISRTNAGTETAGVYAGVLEATGITSINYEISYVSGDYTIVAADQLLVKLANSSSLYGEGADYAVALAGYYSSDDQQVVDLTASAQLVGTSVTITDGASGSAKFDIAVEQPVFSSSNNLKVGTYSLKADNRVLTSPNFSNTLVLQGMLNVEAKTLTASLTSSLEKVYDGNNRLPDIEFSLDIPLSGDVLAVTGTGIYDSKDAGVRNYTVSGLMLTGADAVNYALQGGSLAVIIGTDGLIKQRELRVIPDSGQSKAFGELDPVLTFTYSGQVVGETPEFTGVLSRSPGEPMGTYEITVGTLELTDNTSFVASNYILDLTSNIVFEIKGKSVSDLIISAISDQIFTGEAIEPEIDLIDGGITLVVGVDYEVTYTDNTDVGTATVTIKGIGNYSGEASRTFEIKAKSLSISGSTLTKTKAYDGTTSADVTAGSLVGVATGEDVTVTPVATYDDETVGTGKTITVVYTLSGADAGNYNAPADFEVTDGEITTKSLTIAAPTLTKTKTYEGTTSADVTAGALSGVATGEDVTVTAVATYDDETVGTGKT